MRELSKAGLAQGVWERRAGCMTLAAIAKEMKTSREMVCAILDGHRYEEYWKPSREMRAKVHGRISNMSASRPDLETRIRDIFELIADGMAPADVAARCATSTPYVSRVIRRSNGRSVHISSALVRKANMVLFGEMRVVGSAVV